MNFNRQVYQQTFDQLTSSQKISIVPLEIYDCLPSTNQTIGELIDRGAKMPLAAISLQQTAGKGQWGKQWQSELGGLYLSLGMTVDLPLQDYAHLIMATAWGIANQLRNYNLPVSIKWLNDLILQGKKLGGIKLETRSHDNHLTDVVIGVGINWRNSVPDLGINLESYYQANTAISPQITSLETLSAIVIYGILFGYQQYQELGIDRLINNYQQLLINMKQKIKFEGNLGQIVGVTETGKLKVKLTSPGATTAIYLSPGQISLGYCS